MIFTLSPIAILIASIAGSILLGFLVLRRNSRHATHILFTAMNGAFLVWSIAMFLSLEIQDPAIDIWVIRSVLFLVTIHLSLIFLFVSNFPSSSFRFSKKFIVALSTLSIVSMGLALSPFVFPSMTYENGMPLTIAGPGMVIYMPLTVGMALASVFLIAKKYKAAEGVLRTQLKLIAFGLALMLSLQVSFNFFAPVFFNNTSFIQYGPLFVLVFQAFAAYAILRYRFLELRITIRKSLIITLSVLFTTLIYGWVFSFLESVSPLPSAISWIIAPVFLLLGYEFIKKFTRKILDRYFFVDAFDPSIHLDFEKRYAETIRNAKDHDGNGMIAKKSVMCPVDGRLNNDGRVLIRIDV